MQPLAPASFARGLPAAEAAQRLYACIQEMAERQTNPVLEVLQGVTSVEWERRYPLEHLRFGGACLRAFYHCHRAPGKSADEHGHFHVFVRAPQAADTLEHWTHVAGLSMDMLGQPLGWHAVNRWVSGGLWQQAEKIVMLLDRVEIPPGTLLIERWLGAMLRLFRPEIVDLLSRRDRELSRLGASRAATDILADHAVYALAAQPVDLLARLGSLLAANAEKTAGRRVADGQSDAGRIGRNSLRAL